MVFNATFNNISVILWQSILVVEETTDSLQVTDKLYHMLYSKDSLDNTLGLQSIKFKYIWSMWKNDILPK